MFCDGCGAAVQPGQAFCSRCGKQIVGNIAVMPSRSGRVQNHIRLVGLLWLAFSAFNTVGAVFIYVAAHTILPRIGEFSGQDSPMSFVVPLASVVAILLFAKAAVGFLAGWGALRPEKWARILLLVVAFISLFTNIPFGTALGVYTLWVLLPAESEQEYDALAEAKAA